MRKDVNEHRSAENAEHECNAPVSGPEKKPYETPTVEFIEMPSLEEMWEIPDCPYD